MRGVRLGASTQGAQPSRESRELRRNVFLGSERRRWQERARCRATRLGPRHPPTERWRRAVDIWACVGGKGKGKCGAGKRKKRVVK